MPRNSIPGIGVVNLDLALAKKTMVFRERVGLELRVEMFDALNHTEFNNPNTSRTSPLFGQVTSVVGTGPGQNGSAVGYRVGQLAARLEF